MAVKLNNFVNVKITKDAPTSSKINRMVAYLSKTVSTDSTNNNTYYSLDQLPSTYTIDTDVYKACKVFFDCGGKCIKLVSVAATGTNQDTDDDAYKTSVTNLPTEVLAFACLPTAASGTGTNGGLSVNGLKAIVTYLEGIEADMGTSYRKIMVADTADLTTTTKSNSLAYKYAVKTGPQAQEYACMSILAYLSKINVDNPETLADYCFTKEDTMKVQTGFSNENWTNHGKEVNVTLDIFGGTPINFGGNTSAGTDLVEEYVIIMIAQEIAKVQVQLLQTKLTYANAITKVHSGLISVLEQYYNAGFLVEKVYTGETISRVGEGDGENYTVLSKGEVITGGYHITILPLNSRSETDINNHKLSDVHIILSTAKGIRYIKTEGKVI